MVAFSKINLFTDDLVKGQHKFQSDTFKVLLTNVAPTPTDHLYTDIVEITAQNGYVTGGIALTISLVPSSGVESVNAPSITWTGSGGTFGPFEWAVFYNASQGLLVGYWDYGQAIIVNPGETFTVSPVGGSVFQIS